MSTATKQFTAELSAMAVVICNGKILCTLENIYGKQALSLPKGHVESGETPMQTAIRECFEETNVVLTQCDFVKELSSYSYQFLTPSNKLVQKTITPFLFEIQAERETLVKEERIISVQWMAVQDFLQQCTYDNVKAVVREILG